MTQCWYCDYPIDVDESIEGHTEIHKECLLELSTSGAWDSFQARVQRQKASCFTTIERLDRSLREREAQILATA